jgi:TonB-linked SusC/RagA family outer membrane protein
MKTIFVSMLMLMISVSVFAQNRITGNVNDSNGDPIIGANVKVKGTNNGTMTNVNGDFDLNVEKTGTLIVSYIGFLTQEISIDGKSSLSITMEEDQKTLEEVVVVGYGTQKKASLTSAISSIKGDDAFKDRGINNPTVALQGTIPGLTVTRSSTRPGSEGAAMKIRGDISVNGNSSPLILIDGIAGSIEELNQMDPNNIDNISVLKDASAAIYGARSASGVVLVTTKRGKQGKTKITYSGSASTTMDGIKIPLTNGQEWLDMFYEAQYQDARASNPTLTSHNDLMTVFNWWIFPSNSVLGGQEVNTGEIYEKDKLWKALRNGESLTIRNGATVHRFEPGHTFLDALYGQATSTKHSANVSGGDDKFTYMASLGYVDNQSQLKVAEDGEKKYNGRLNVDFQATKRLKLETGMSYEIRNISTPSTDVGAGWYDPWFWPMYNEAGNFYDTFDKRRNPLGGIVGGGRINDDYTTFRGNLKATIDLSDLLKGLSISGTGGYKKLDRATQTLFQKVEYYDWENNYMNQHTGNNNPGRLTEQNRTYTNITLGGFVNYDNTFASDHHVTAMLGITSEEEVYKNITAARLNGPLYEGSGLVDLNVMTSGTNNVAEGGQSEWAFLSYITRLNYAYKSKYLVEFLGRRDGSSKLYPEQRWKNFFSVSGAYVITGEEFMKNLTWLDFLKVRYNYGKTGSVEGIGNYEQYATISSGSAYFGESLAAQPSLTLGGMTSATRTWETINSHDVGLDFAFLKNRLSGSFDYFKKTNEGMFISVTYPSILGTSAPKSNNGKFGTNGWEFTLNWRDKIKDFTYNVGGWIADADSKLLEWPDNENVPNAGKNSNRLVGKPRDAIYVYNTDGIFQTQAEANEYYEKYYWADAAHTGPKSGNILPAPQTTGTNRLRPGARKLVDANGDGAITTDDLVYAGDAAPHFTFGFNLGLEWKGFDLKAFFQGVGEQVVLRTGNLRSPWFINYSLQNKTYMGKMWSDIDIPSLLDGVEYAVNANTGSNYAIASRDNNFNRFNYENKDVLVQNSRYLRLKSLVVGYTLPKTLTQKVKIDRLRIYVSGDDLWEKTSIKDGYDPEYGEEIQSTFPFSRLLSCGLEISF